MTTLLKKMASLAALFFRPRKEDAIVVPAEPIPFRHLAWGLKVSDAFRVRVFEIARILDVEPDYLMACMAFESAETFSPSVRNAAGSGATGLIQFMPPTAIGFFHSKAQIKAMTAVQRRQAGLNACLRLAAMTAEQQLEYVLQYFMPYQGRLTGLADVYMAILWPAGIGKADHWELWSLSSRPVTYRQNAGLDSNRDGRITKAEASAKVQAALARGRLPGFLWEQA
ncbi:MAG TPA: hypothetical protein PLP85_14325 [Alcaligenes sp.]|nr:hypothetical protein [Alcaligenes sp.]